MAEQPLLVVTRSDLHRWGGRTIYGASAISVASSFARSEWAVSMVAVAVVVLGVGVVMVVAAFRWKRP